MTIAFVKSDQVTFLPILWAEIGLSQIHRFEHNFPRYVLILKLYFKAEKNAWINDLTSTIV